jgi:phosphonate transport system substrate-binding protein
LAESIKTAMYAFDWSDSSLAKEFSTIGASQFVPVDYKQDFQLIREIDNAMGRRHAIEERVTLDESLRLK